MFFWLHSFSSKVTFLQLEDFFFIFFQVERALLDVPKSEATSLGEVPFSSSLRALYLTLKIYLSVGALLQTCSPSLMSDVFFYRIKINKVDATRTFGLVFNI